MTRTDGGGHYQLSGTFINHCINHYSANVIKIQRSFAISQHLESCTNEFCSIDSLIQLLSDDHYIFRRNARIANSQAIGEIDLLTYVFLFIYLT